MSSRQDRPSRGRDVARHQAGTGIAVGAAIGGLAGLAWALFLGKKHTQGGEEESPVIIKSGSLATYVKDVNGRIAKKDELYEVTSADFIDMKEWDVSIVELEAGFPVTGPTPFTKVSSVVLYVVGDENGKALDTITITFNSAREVLIVAAATDSRFGDRTDQRKVTGKTKHKVRAISKEVKGEKHFVVDRVTVNHAGGSNDFDSGCDYAMACTFYK